MSFMTTSEPGNEVRRRKFRERGYVQVEVWVPELTKRRVHVAKAMRGDRGMNDVIVEALEEWLDKHGIPKGFPIASDPWAGSGMDDRALRDNGIRG
jgi:hypothetical protein